MGRLMATAATALLLPSGLATAQILSPPQPDPPRVIDIDFPANQQPTSVIIGTTHRYKVCWVNNVPYHWDWQPVGQVTRTDVTSNDPMCVMSTLRYNAAGGGGVKVVYWSDHIYWNPSNLYLTVRQPKLSDTTGPFRICGRITRNGANVGANVTHCRTNIPRTAILGNTSGITASIPANVNVVCGVVIDLPTGWKPMDGANPVKKCTNSWT